MVFLLWYLIARLPAPTAGYGDKVVVVCWAPHTLNPHASVRFAFIFLLNRIFFPPPSVIFSGFFFFFFFLHPSFNLFTSSALFYLLNVMPFSFLYSTIRKSFWSTTFFTILQVATLLCLTLQHVSLSLEHNTIFCLPVHLINIYPLSTLLAPPGNTAGDGQTNWKIYLFIIFSLRLQQGKGRGQGAGALLWPFTWTRRLV